MSIVVCEFSLFVNIKELHNIRDNKLNQAFFHLFLLHRRSLQTDIYEFFIQILTKFIHNLMDWIWMVYGHSYSKLSRKRSNTFSIIVQL